MKTHSKLIVIIALNLAINTTGIAQLLPFVHEENDSLLKIHMAARRAYVARDFCKALKIYEEFWDIPRYKGKNNNYDAYFMAIAACKCGDMQKAAQYIKLSGDIGYDGSAYEQFANDSLNRCLKNLPEWQTYINTFKYKTDSTREADARVLNDMKNFRVNAGELTEDIFYETLKTMSLLDVMKQIKTFNQYQPPGKIGTWVYYEQKINDTIVAPFSLYIPANYNPEISSPLFVYLHGAASNSTKFGNPATTPMASFNYNVFQEAIKNNAFILFPFAKRNFNWLFNANAMSAIVEYIIMIKKRYNIDDNRVYVGGHSDGGRGTMWFAMEKRTQFAGFLPLSYYPFIFRKNNCFGNLNNEGRIVGVNGKGDELFNVSNIKSIYEYAKEKNANWVNYITSGGHSLPTVSPTPDTVMLAYKMLFTQTRNPLPKKIYWESDNNWDNEFSWLKIIELDTTKAAAGWHSEYDSITIVDAKGIENNTPVKGKKNGAVIAEIKRNNNIYITTSRIKKLTLNIYEGMVNFNKPIKIRVDKLKLVTISLKPDKQMLIDEFKKTGDRVMLKLQEVRLEITTTGVKVY